MKHFDWDRGKNTTLLKERGVSFDMVVACIEEDQILAHVQHPNQKKYPHQKIYVVAIDNYAYAVPYVEDEEKIFLKTIIPSRKLTRQYLHHEQDR